MSRIIFIEGGELSSRWNFATSKFGLCTHNFFLFSFHFQLLIFDQVVFDKPNHVSLVNARWQDTDNMAVVMAEVIGGILVSLFKVFRLNSKLATVEGFPVLEDFPSNLFLFSESSMLNPRFLAMLEGGVLSGRQSKGTL